MSQTSYNDRAVAQAGQMVYGKVRGILESKACGTAAGIDFGRVVGRGSADNVCVVGGQTPFGVARYDHGQGMDEDSEGRYEYKSMVSVVDKDYVYLNTVSTSGAYRAKVYYLIADSSSGAGDAGTVVVTDAPGVNHRLIGYLGQTLTAAGLAKVYVDTDVYFNEVACAAAAETAAEDFLDENQDAIDDATAPAPVTSLSAAVGNTQTVVTWTDPEDTDIDHMIVEVAVASTGVVDSRRRVAAAAETITIGSLSNGTEYAVYVWAVDTDGNYSAVETDTVTPSA